MLPRVHRLVHVKDVADRKEMADAAQMLKSYRDLLSQASEEQAGWFYRMSKPRPLPGFANPGRALATGKSRTIERGGSTVGRKSGKVDEPLHQFEKPQVGGHAGLRGVGPQYGVRSLQVEHSWSWMTVHCKEW